MAVFVYWQLGLVCPSLVWALLGQDLKQGLTHSTSETCCLGVWCGLSSPAVWTAWCLPAPCQLQMPVSSQPSVVLCQVLSSPPCAYAAYCSEMWRRAVRISGHPPLCAHRHLCFLHLLRPLHCVGAPLTCAALAVALVRKLGWSRPSCTPLARFNSCS